VSKNNAQDSTPYVPKTDEERNEAFGLLDELLNELAREEALRRELARSLLLKRQRAEQQPQPRSKQPLQPQPQQLPQDDLSSGQT
jgi:hypothetical protein